MLAQAIRPLVWEKGLWSTELEKAWTHLFDIVACLMKLGYPQEYQVAMSSAKVPGSHEMSSFIPYEYQAAMSSVTKRIFQLAMSLATH